MKKLILILTVLVLAQPLAAQQKKQNQKLDLDNFLSHIDDMKTKDKDLRHALWSVAVADAKSGEFLYRHNSNFSLLPASNMKIVTTGVGLLMLGADYKFKTKLEYTGAIVDSVLDGDIYITGGGDPSLGSEIYKNTVPDSVFYQWIQGIRSIGIKKINGRIIADTRFFDDENRGGSWELNDIGTSYGAGHSGLQFIDNMCRLHIEPASTVEKKPNLLRVEPYIPNVSWENHLTSVDDEDKAGWDIYCSPYSERVQLLGTMKTNGKTRRVGVALPNPAYTCAWYFNKYLNQNGVPTSNRIEVLERRTPVFNEQKRTHFYTYESPALIEIVWQTNKDSNNSFAETILKTIGAELGDDGTTAEGSRLLAKKLEEIGVNTDGFKQSDGSGLSRQNYVTSDFLCAYLSKMYNNEMFANFIYSFPIAGVDGTMKNMLRNTAAEKNVKAKSGSLSGTRAYSGYVTTKSGKDLCFSFIFNNYTCKTAMITRKMEKLMIALAEAE